MMSRSADFISTTMVHVICHNSVTSISKTVKATAEPIIAGRITPDMLAVPCLYGLRSAHATVRTTMDSDGSILLLTSRARAGTNTECKHYQDVPDIAL